VTSSSSFDCGQLQTCTLSWACNGDERAVGWSFDITNYKESLTAFEIVKVRPTDALDGFLITGQSRSPFENTEWKINVVCVHRG
jgi:hypothetical protein